MVIGLLTKMARDLGADLATAGLLISVYAMAISVGSPMLAHATKEFHSKPVCVFLIVVFALANFFSALIPSFAAILIARVIAGAMHGAYFSVASTVAPSLVEPSKAPLAIAVMFAGLTVAMVIGVPTGIGLGQALGWQSVFVTIGVLSIVAAVLVHRFVPLIDDKVSHAETAPFRAHLSKELLTLYLVTIFGFGGGFVFFSYVEPYMTEMFSATPAGISMAMALIGLGALAGNALGGKLPSSLGLMRALAVVVTCEVTVLVAIALTPTLPLAFFCLIFAWSMVCFSIGPMVQSGVVMLADGCKGLNPRLSAGLNATAFNVGISLATFLASGLVAGNKLPMLPIVAAVMVLIALPLCHYSGKPGVLRLKRASMGE